MWCNPHQITMQQFSLNPYKYFNHNPWYFFACWSSQALLHSRINLKQASGSDILSHVIKNLPQKIIKCIIALHNLSLIHSLCKAMTFGPDDGSRKKCKSVQRTTESKPLNGFNHNQTVFIKLIYGVMIVAWLPYCRILKPNQWSQTPPFPLIWKLESNGSNQKADKCYENH